MQTSPTVGALAAALAKAQTEIKNVVKDANNPFFKSKYAPLDAVIDAIKVALPKNGIAFFQSPKSEGKKVSVTTRLIHASGEWIETDALEATAKDEGSQAVGSVITYLRRYSLQAAAGIAATDDDDAEAAEGRHVEPAPQRANGNGNGVEARKASLKEKVLKQANGSKPSSFEADVKARLQKLGMQNGKDRFAWIQNALTDFRGDEPMTEAEWTVCDGLLKEQEQGKQNVTNAAEILGAIQ